MPACAAAPASASATSSSSLRRCPGSAFAHLPLMILIASLSALLAVAALHLSGRRIGAGTQLPFGPFLVLGLHGAQLLRPDF